ncbi:MAG: hypothetical protein WBP11_11715 [Dokdonella sp.]
MNPIIQPPRLVWPTFAFAAALMLAATVSWQLPMMLWDQLDFVLIYQRWQSGELDAATLLAPYNGAHVLTIPYLSMLATVSLGNGSTWPDGVASWLAMVATAVIVIRVALREMPIHGARSPWLVLVLLALYPGHLSNLQWGWQVQIFSCLLGAVAAIALLSAASTSTTRMIGALTAAVIAGLSFGASIVLLPIALFLIALRTDMRWPRKAAWSLPWLILGLLATLPYLQGIGSTADPHSITLFEICHYTLNFIGSGIARFATDLAPWLALVAIVSALDAWLKLARNQRGSAWLGFLLFGIGTALITAVVRVGPFGADQAFAQRYISFSALFWLGWYGLLLKALPHVTPFRRRIYSGLMGICAVLLVANALHLIRKAAITHERGVATVNTIANTWPNVDEKVLRAIYFDQPEAARERLELLHRFGFAPFNRARNPPENVPPKR